VAFTTHTDVDRAILINADDAAILIAVLNLSEPGGYSYASCRPSVVTFASISVSLSICDEAGKIDINFAPRPALVGLFTAAGSEANDATTEADAVLNWREPMSAGRVDGSTNGIYENETYPYLPRNAPLESVGELQLVAGMTPAIFDKISPTLSVYSHESDVDPSVEVEPLRMLLGHAIPLLPAADGNREPQLSGLTIGHTFSIVAYSQRGGYKATRQATVLLTGNPFYPLWVYQWE
jgi:general secretion pathway protein K